MNITYGKSTTRPILVNRIVYFRKLYIEASYYHILNLITILAGGTGSVKLIRGLASQTRDLTVISNIGDNIWLHGLYSLS